MWPVAIVSSGCCFLCVDQFDCRVWYAGQLPQSSICHSSGHRAPAYPSTVLRVRECTPVWGPSDAAPGPGPATDMSCEPSASSDHAMADASPAVLDSVPVFLFLFLPLSLRQLLLFLLLPSFLSVPLLPLLMMPQPLFLLLPLLLLWLPLFLKCLLSLD